MIDKETQCLEIVDKIKDVFKTNHDCSDIESYSHGIVYDRNNYTNFVVKFHYGKPPHPFNKIGSKYLNGFFLEHNTIAISNKEPVCMNYLKSLVSNLNNKKNSEDILKSIELLTELNFKPEKMLLSTDKTILYIHFYNIEGLKAQFSIEANF